MNDNIKAKLKSIYILFNIYNHLNFIKLEYVLVDNTVVFVSLQYNYYTHPNLKFSKTINKWLFYQSLCTYKNIYSNVMKLKK